MTDTTYFRQIVLSNLPIKGHFRFDDIFQILSPDTGAPKPPYAVAHHPVIFEYHFDVLDEERINLGKDIEFQNSIPERAIIDSVIRKKFNELLRVLSVLTNCRFFIYNTEQAWFIPVITREILPLKWGCVWGQKSYSYPEFKTQVDEFSVPECPAIKIADPQEYYNRFGADYINADFPTILRSLLSKYFSLTNNVREVFLSSCALFCQGFDSWSNMGSMSFVAFVSAIETLMDYDYRDKRLEECGQCHQLISSEYQCPKCKRPIWGVRAKFREFLNMYASPDPQFKQYANKLQDMRSNILHRGILLINDLHPSFVPSKEFLQQEMLHRGLMQTTRICLVKWLDMRHGLEINDQK